MAAAAAAGAVLVVSSLLLFNACFCSAQILSNTPLHSSCGGNYTTGNDNTTTFKANLATLFASLTARAPLSNFYNGTAGDGGANQVYGLYMCEGDLSSDDCRGCVDTAAAGLLQTCPASRQGIIWYDYCQLRFADFNFFGVADARGFPRKNPFATVFNPSLPLGVLSRLVDVAPNQPLKFAANASVTAGVYAMAQCTDDLSSGDCSRCLQTVLQNIKDCCSDAQGYRYLSPSCWVRYEATPFLRNVNSTFTSIVVPRCPNDTFPQNSRGAWETKLSSLLSSLSSNSPKSGGFNTSVVGDASSGRLYGLALCRPDLANSTDACRTCLTNASSSLTQMCPVTTQGAVWYEQCEVRYSNASFFGVVDGVGRTFCSLEETSQEYDDASLNLMARLVEAAPEQPLMSAAGGEAISTSASSYGLVQCTRDLNREQCRSCLRKGMTNVSSSCRLKRGWRYLSGSCNLRYEDFAFFDTSIALVTPQEQGTGKGKSSKIWVIAIIIPILGAVLLGWLIYLRRRKRTIHGGEIPFLHDLETYDKTDHLHLVDLGTILAATDNFSNINKIGEGGFGAVYKGTLQGGQVIAIKRLSTRSNQGSEEFKNEATLIAKLQHRNLLRTLGYCVEREEKMLIYEYMPNGSLDAFIFDQRNRASLNWKCRFTIIIGIGRGLLYLHEDSQLKIVHRDLKPSNVLLDHEMNPKIADFGMAKIFRNDENEASTRRLAGTFGYMAPEYAKEGKFSVKSDVFSFGVLLLEIISGEKNSRFHFPDSDLTLVKHAWQLWTEGRVLQLVDPLIAHSCSENEVLRCVHIGLLCVQDNPENRPTMSSIMVMLMSDQMALPELLLPPTFVREITGVVDQCSSSSRSRSVNELSITAVQPR